MRNSRLLRNCSGTAALEAALLIGLVLFPILSGAFVITRIITIHQQLHLIGSTAADIIFRNYRETGVGLVTLVQNIQTEPPTTTGAGSIEEQIAPLVDLGKQLAPDFRMAASIYWCRQDPINVANQHFFQIQVEEPRDPPTIPTSGLPMCNSTSIAQCDFACIGDPKDLPVERVIYGFPNEDAGLLTTRFDEQRIFDFGRPGFSPDRSYLDRHGFVVIIETSIQHPWYLSWFLGGTAYEAAIL